MFNLDPNNGHIQICDTPKHNPIISNDYSPGGIQKIFKGSVIEEEMPANDTILYPSG